MCVCVCLSLSLSPPPASSTAAGLVAFLWFAVAVHLPFPLPFVAGRDSERVASYKLAQVQENKDSVKKKYNQRKGWKSTGVCLH